MRSFYIMNKNRKVCKVVISGLKVTLEKYSDKLSDKQFPTDTPTIEEVYAWIEERCFPESRANKKELLEAMGLTLYEPLEIVKITHGLLHEDYNWILWEGEEINYEDIKIRD